MEILLLFAALILIFSFSPIGLVAAFLKSLFTWKIQYFKDYCYNIAGSIDQLGNVIMSPLFNSILIKKNSVNKFGDKDETISSVLGRNQKANKLRYLGKRLVALLDWFEKDHSIKSIGT